MAGPEGQCPLRVGGATTCPSEKGGKSPQMPKPAGADLGQSEQEGKASAGQEEWENLVLAG